MAENKKDILKMAMIYTQEGKWDKAILEYKKLIVLDPTDYNIHNMLGDVYAKKGEDALAYQEYVLTAEAYAKQGLNDKANLVLKKIAKLDTNKLPEPDRKKHILIKKNAEAEKFIEEGNIDKAIEVYKEILQINPDSFDTYQKIGELYAEKGMKEESLKYLYKIAEIYHKNRLFKKAIPIYLKIIEIQQDNIQVREKLAEAFERDGRETDAKKEYIFITNYYLSKNDYEKVDYFARKAIESKSIEAHYYRALALYHKKDYDEAKKEIEMLLKFKMNSKEGLILSAKISKERGDFDSAINTLSKLSKTDAENVEIYELVGDLYLQKKQEKEAESKYIMAINLCIKDKNFKKAEEIINKILNRNPYSVDALNKYAEVLNLQNNKKQAADIYIKIAEIFNKENLLDKEKEYLKLAEEMDPAHPKLIERAKKLSAESKIEQTVEIGKKEVFDKKEEIFVLPDLKEVTFETKKEEKLKEPIIQEPIKKETIKIDEFKLPDLPDQIVLGKTEKVKETEKPFAIAREQIVSEVKDDVPSLIAMAEAFIKTGDFDQAIEMYQKALTIEPFNETIKEKLNKVYSQYAGVTSSVSEITSLPEDIKISEKKEQEEEKKRQEEEKKRQEEERKKQEEERKRQEEERKRQEEEKKRQEEEKKRQEEERKKQEEERKRQEEEKKREKVEVLDGKTIFSTVVSAEIFIKQGLLLEAEKILRKIVEQDVDNMEAKNKLEEIKKLKGEEKEEDKEKKKSAGKVSYI